MRNILQYGIILLFFTLPFAFNSYASDSGEHSMCDRVFSKSDNEDFIRNQELKHSFNRDYIVINIINSNYQTYEYINFYQLAEFTWISTNLSYWDSDGKKIYEDNRAFKLRSSDAYKIIHDVGEIVIGPLEMVLDKDSAVDDGDCYHIDIDIHGTKVNFVVYSPDLSKVNSKNSATKIVDIVLKYLRDIEKEHSRFLSRKDFRNHGAQ